MKILNFKKYCNMTTTKTTTSEIFLVFFLSIDICKRKRKPEQKSSNYQLIRAEIVFFTTTRIFKYLFSYILFFFLFFSIFRIHQID